MMTEIIRNIAVFLPLSIDLIEWNDPCLTLVGKNWNFFTTSSWRIIESNKLICGCYDNDAFKTLNEIKNLDIISIDIQSNHLLADPIFLISNGYKLEIFSTIFFEPWTFNFSSGIVYVSSPSDPNNFR